MVGLAIYNGVLLDVHFPRAVYKKMCGEPLGVDDLEGYDADIWRSLRAVRDYAGDVSELTLCFSVDFVEWDQQRPHDLVEGGRDVAVTDGNKGDYVRRLCRYYLVDSVAAQFDAFLAGFKPVLRGRAFDMIRRGKELELLICGNQLLDFDALEVACRYEGGYDDECKYVRWLWRILHALDARKKKQFFAFSAARTARRCEGSASSACWCRRRRRTTTRATSCPPATPASTRCCCPPTRASS